MKRGLPVYVKIFLITVLISSCTPIKIFDCPEPRPYGVSIVKFKNPEYARYIAARLTLADDGNRQAYQFGYAYPKVEYGAGRCPYVYLGDGYYLSRCFTRIAWLYPCDLSDSPPVFLLDLMWENVPVADEDRNVSLVDLNTPVITTNPAIEVYKFDYQQLDAFLGTNYKEMMPEYFRRSVQLYDPLLVDSFYSNLSDFRLWEDLMWFEFTEKDEYFKVCDSIGQIYMTLIQDAFNTRREELFRAGANHSNFKCRR